MRIEKINENSIELTVNGAELKLRNMSIKDLSYGSDEAKKLLLEVINLANTEVGFKADAPLSVEAVPLKDGAMKLIITKILSSDELDARYSRFTPLKPGSVPMSIIQMLESTFDKFEEALKMGSTKGINQVNTINKLEIKKENNIVNIFEFDSIDKASDACKNVSNYDYVSVLYKDEKNLKFYLVLNTKSDTTKESISEFNKVCNTLAEYGKKLKSEFGMNEAYYEEHYKVIIKDNAVYKLSSL